jgi:hypothetical protein
MRFPYAHVTNMSSFSKEFSHSSLLAVQTVSDLSGKKNLAKDAFFKFKAQATEMLSWEHEIEIDG